MTDMELAVSRLTAWLRDYGDDKAKANDTSKAFIGDVTMVVMAAKEQLRQHPADENEPCTQEWLMAIGFEEVGYWTYERKLFLSPITVRAYAREGRRWDLSLFAGEHHIKDNPTRGEIRQLCRSLAVELKN